MKTTIAKDHVIIAVEKKGDWEFLRALTNTNGIRNVIRHQFPDHVMPWDELSAKVKRKYRGEVYFSYY